MTVTHAITRLPAPSFAEGLTTAALGAPSYETMRRQHAAYVSALRALDLDVTVLAPCPEYPDAHFIEDAAVVLPEIAIVTRPGAPERRGEEALVVPALSSHRALARIEAPGTLDGGDVLEIGRRIFVGLSSRTNRAGAEQLGAIVEAHGYAWASVPVGAGLHLKSSVNRLTDEIVIIGEDLAQHRTFARYRCVVVDSHEAYSANALEINGTVLLPSGFPATRAKLERLDIPVVELDMSESEKMDGGLTCLSLRFTSGGHGPDHGGRGSAPAVPPA